MCAAAARSVVTASKPTKTKAFLQQMRLMRDKIRGFVPFYKEAGVSGHHVRDWLKLHLEDEWGVTLNSFGLTSRVSKPMEPPFSGVCFLSMGTLAIVNNDKFFQDMDCVHDVSLRLGMKTDTQVLIPGIPSEVLETTDVSHITYDDIFFTLKKKVDYTQVTMYETGAPLRYPDHKPLIDRNFWFEEDTRSSEKHWAPDPEDKSGRFSERPQVTRFRQVSILSYNPPFLRLRIEANGRFAARPFAQHLADLLKTNAVVTECERISFGPVTIDDCLRKHQMYFSDLSRAANHWSPLLHYHFMPFLHKQEIDKRRKKYITFMNCII